MAKVHPNPHDREKSNTMMVWAAAAVLVAAVLIYVLVADAWGTPSAPAGADTEVQRTAVQPSNADGQPATAGTPKGVTPRP